VHERESTPLTGWMWLARVMTAVQRVCYALEAAVRSPLLFRFRAGFHCQIVDVVGRSHSRRNQGAAAVLAPEKTPVFMSAASGRDQVALVNLDNPAIGKLERECFERRA
jgi:hypothetical protein